MARHQRRIMAPQTALILKHLQKTGDISVAEAWTAYGCRSLPRRILDLKNYHGVKIRMELKKHPITKQRYSRYHLVETQPSRTAA